MYIIIESIMKFLILKTTNPYVNLAIEEYLFLNENEDVFMLWQNEPTVVIGKNQSAYAEINMDFIRKNNIHIARRITGGGAVYHDLGNVNYSFITDKTSKDLDFKIFTSPIINALTSLGVKTELSGRNDLLIDGRKFSGNAQSIKNDRVLHHGTLLFNSELDALSNALKVNPEKIKSKAIKSVHSRVTNLKPFLPEEYTVEDFLKDLSEYIISVFNPEIIEPPTNKEIDFIFKRNASVEWIFPKGNYLSKYAVQKTKKYPFGLVDMFIDMSNDTLSKIKIQGDFFGIKDITELEIYLENTNFNELETKLSQIEIGEYIFGMSTLLFVEQIKGIS